MSNTTITINFFSDKPTIYMREMRPLQVGRIVKTHFPEYMGRIVMRTASTNHFEVIDLSANKPDNCWSNTQDCGENKVQLLDAELVVNIK